MRLMLKAGERGNDWRHKARNSCEMRQSLGCDGARMLLSWASAVEGVAPDPKGRWAIGSDPVGEIRCWALEAQFAEFCELSNRSRRVGASEAASGTLAEMERCLLTRHADVRGRIASLCAWPRTGASHCASAPTAQRYGERSAVLSHLGRSSHVEGDEPSMQTLASLRLRWSVCCSSPNATRRNGRVARNLVRRCLRRPWRRTLHP